jgi:hypothetical protein
MKPRQADVASAMSGVLFLLVIVAVDLAVGPGIFEDPSLWVPLGILTGLAMFVSANQLEESKIDVVEQDL